MLHLYNRYRRFELGLLVRWMFRTRRWEQAARLLGQLIDIYPDAPQSYRRLGDAYFRLERWEEAETAYQSAVRLDSTQPLAFLRLGEVLSQQHRWESAAEAFGSSIVLDARSPLAYQHLGDALCKLGRFADAVAAYEQALALSSENALLLQNLGNALAKLEHWEQAEAACLGAIGLDSSMPLSYLYLGEALAQQGRQEKAAEAFRRSISLDSNNPWPHHHLGDALFKLGQCAESVTVYQQALALLPENPASLENLGNALSKLNRWSEAESAYLGARSIAGDNPRLAEALGGVWLKLQRWEEAASAYEQCVAQCPDSIELRRNLGIAVFKFETHKAYCAAHPDAKSITQCSEYDNVSLPELDWTADRFGARVIEIERWVESLVPKSGRLLIEPAGSGKRSAENARLLFVLDNDYGELTTVMYLLLGQDWADRVMLLLPDHLYQTNSQAIPGRTFRFGSIQEVEHAIDSFHPDIAFLCSGYLYAMHDLFSLEELEHLIDFLGKRDCKVVTADPFLGMLSRRPVSSLISVDFPDASELTLPAHVFRHLADVKQEQDEWLIEKLSGAERILRDHLHVYPAHASPSAEEASTADFREIAFFNPRLICTALPETDNETKPHWVFILSGTDLETQQMFEAVRGFTEIVARLLKQAIAAGRRPIFVGPEKFVRELVRAMRGHEGAELLSFCSFTRLAALLLAAEYAFYWNSVSHSILLRSFNGLPVILFDRGHLVRNIEAIYERVIQWYYQGVQPIYLDHCQPLTLEVLDKATVDFRRDVARMGQDYKRAPEPASLIEHILGTTRSATG